MESKKLEEFVVEIIKELIDKKKKGDTFTIQNLFDDAGLGNVWKNNIDRIGGQGTAGRISLAIKNQRNNIGIDIVSKTNTDVVMVYEKL